MLFNTYKESFLEAKKAEQKGYWFCIIIASICLSTALKPETDVTIPFFNITLATKNAVYCLLAMYSTCGLFVSHQTYKSSKALYGLKSSSKLVKALYSYPYILNIENSFKKVIPLLFPIFIMFLTFKYGSQAGYTWSIICSLIFSAPLLIVLIIKFEI